MQLIPRAAPRRPGLPKNARSRLNAGGRIERSGGYDGALAVAAEPWHGRTTCATNRRGKTFGARQIEPLCLIPARDPLQVRRLGDQVGRVPAPRGLAAARAVAMIKPLWRPADFVAHGTAETTSPKVCLAHEFHLLLTDMLNITLFVAERARRDARGAGIAVPRRGGFVPPAGHCAGSASGSPPAAAGCRS